MRCHLAYCHCWCTDPYSYTRQKFLDNLLIYATANCFLCHATTYWSLFYCCIWCVLRMFKWTDNYGAKMCQYMVDTKLCIECYKQHKIAAVTQTTPYPKLLHHHKVYNNLFKNSILKSHFSNQQNDTLKSYQRLYW